MHAAQHHTGAKPSTTPQWKTEISHFLTCLIRKQPSITPGTRYSNSRTHEITKNARFQLEEISAVIRYSRHVPWKRRKKGQVRRPQNCSFSRRKKASIPFTSAAYSPPNPLCVRWNVFMYYTFIMSARVMVEESDAPPIKPGQLTTPSSFDCCNIQKTMTESLHFRQHTRVPAKGIWKVISSKSASTYGQSVKVLRLQS
jgi:hypothetical protein